MAATDDPITAFEMHSRGRIEAPPDPGASAIEAADGTPPVRSPIEMYTRSSADARADIADEGPGGHTPLFPGVNGNQNHCRPAMELLAAAGASLDVRVKGLIRSGGFEWDSRLDSRNRYLTDRRVFPPRT